jgi:DNA-binding protein HU-beta
MIKADLEKQVMDSLELPQGKASDAVNTVFDAMRGALTRGERIELRGFGVFIVKPRKRGIGRNPKTGVEVAIPPGKTIRFKPGKALRTI